MTLGELAILKESTVSDIVQYANGKGLSLAEDSNYQLTDSELKKIDPILYFKLKRDSRTKGSSNNEAPVKETVQSALTQGNTVLFKDSEVVNQAYSAEETRGGAPKKRQFGFVKFFDSYKGFGYIITNRITKRQKVPVLDSIRVDQKNLIECDCLKSNQWVSFEKEKGELGWFAINVRIVNCNSKDLVFALKEYVGKKSRIKGQDKKGDDYDVNIFCQIATSFVKTEGEQKLFDIISEYFSNIEDTSKRDRQVELFATDSQTREFLLKATSVDLDRVSKTIMSAVLLKEIIEAKNDIDWSLIDKWYSFLDFSEELYDIILSKAFEKNNLVRIASLSEDFIKALLSRSKSTSFSHDNLKDIYATYPSKIPYFINKDTIEPFERGLLYLCSEVSTSPLDAESFMAMVLDDTLIKTFVSKYFSTDRKNDNVLGIIDKVSKKKAVSSLTEDLAENLPVEMKFEYFISHKNYKKAGELAANHVENSGQIQRICQSFFEISESGINITTQQYRDFIDSFTISKIKEFTSHTDIHFLPESFIYASLTKFKAPLWGNLPGLSDDYYIKSYIFSNGDISYLSNINIENINHWFDGHQSDECGEFLSVLLNSDDETNIIDAIDCQYIAKGLKNLEESVQFELVNKLPLPIAKRIVTEYFNETNLQQLFIAERWEELKLKIPHITFDIESDGEKVSEFAFRYEENTRALSSNQIGALIRRLNSAPIVVGHNIKEWDLPILEQHGLVITGFVWDTLEIELLLNPCRYAYSLHTSHIAKDDTELTDRLFWNQLMRLSRNQTLCKELESYLPAEITEYLQLIQDPFFENYLKHEAGNGYQFFQELIPLDKSVVWKLNELNAASTEGRILIIAPKDIWSRIAQYVSLSFPTDTSKAYRSIDAQRIASTQADILMQKVLSRFCDESATPIVANIPKYLLCQKGNNTLYLSDEQLEELSEPSNGNIDCIDFNAFDKGDVLKKSYTKIVTIGGELYDRIHKIQIGNSYDLISPSIVLSRLFLSMAACNYAKVPVTDYESFGITKDELTASVWAERDASGKISIYKNFKFKLAKAKFLSKSNASHEKIDWKLQGQEKKSFSPTAVMVKSCEDNVRLAESTTFRSKYWAYQFGIIAKLNPQLPVIYVVNSPLEVESVCKLARNLGYYVPSYGTGFRKLEHIGSHSKGMAVITKEQFINGIGEYRTDQPYCYIWDNMDIDRLRLMWDVLPFEDDNVEDGTEEPDSKSGRTTPRKCIVAAWPLMNHYYSLIKANSRDSQMYVLDSYFDENPDIADICRCEVAHIESPTTDCGFNAIVVASEECFNNLEFTMPNLDIEQAMKTILINFIPGDKVEWHDYQKEILPHILQRREDLLISLPTGGGKSVLFQGPAIYRAAFSRRLSIVISPLRALMQDQVEELNKKGFGNAVDYISGDRTYQEVQEIYRRIRGGEIALLYITPERFRVRGFTNALQCRLEKDNGLEYIIFDEAHCISQWGQEFRPDYRSAILECSKLKENFDIRLCLLSATVTSQIEADIRSFLPEIKRMGQSAEDYNPVRQHIGISFKLSEHEDERRIEEICKYITDNNINFEKSRMIIFCRTQRQCEEVSISLNKIFQSSSSQVLNQISDHIGFFHAGMDSDQREDVYKRFKGKVKAGTNQELFILCATKAFGMGMDIPNIHYVLHFSPPSVMEDYLQEVGRAGRNADMYNAVFANGQKIPAQCLVSSEDFRKLKELLIKSMMSWSDLEMARQKIVEYILRFKEKQVASISQTVVPFDVWTKDDSPSGILDTTVSRVAFHWLKHIGLISLGYLDQACMDVTLLKPWSTIGISAPNTFKETIADAIHTYCKEFGVRSMIPIKEMRERANRTWSKIVDVLLQAQQKSILTINDHIRCLIKPRRNSETNYMIDRGQNAFALHIALNGIQTFLSGMKVRSPRVIESEELRSFVNHLMDDVEFETFKENNIEYMPWGKSNVPMDVTRADTFKNDILTRVGSKIFWMVNYIPGVSSVEKRTAEGDFTYTVTIHNEQWRDFIVQWETDLLEILKYIKKHDTSFSWAEMMLELGIFQPGEKGYTYLDNSLSLLSALQYIVHTPLVRSGIEVQTTDSVFQPIEDGLESNSEMYSYRQEFEQEEKLKKIRLSAMDIFSKISHDMQSEFIRRYFQCRNYDEFLELVGEFCPEKFSDILSELSEEALSEAEGKLKDNEAQLRIYNSPITENINVLAGPGSGKTHVLTLRCAKLVYREHVDPSHILVLAYNRAVVVELKTRLNKLFRSIGLSRMANQMHVYTFHALAKVVMGNELDSITTDQWESKLCEFIQNRRNLFKAKFPDIDYILIDEFQDIKEERIHTIKKLHEYYPDARFFTIGDINQSIYGFERVAGFVGTPKQYAERLSPLPYYELLRELLHPTELSMFTNYRSYQKILDKSAEFLPPGSVLPKSSDELMKSEPAEPYVHEFSNIRWFSKLPEIISKANDENLTGDPERSIETIAIFFRTNNEVYRGFSRLKTLNIDSSIRVRIQGTSSCELWRQRELYHIISYFSKNSGIEIELKNDKTKSLIRGWVEQIIQAKPNWDSYYIDVAYILFLNYLESIRADERTHTYGELAEYMKDIAGKDDGGQVFKIYDEYQSERIFKEKHLTIVLTTMHKVKGLEFDIVVVTPSFANLPLRPHRVYSPGQPLLDDDLADIEEEQRLRFVAYTRAKKMLYIFNSDREQALARREIYLPPENLQSQLGITEKEPGLDKYNLGYHSNSEFTFNGQQDLVNLATNSQVEIRAITKQKKTGESWISYEIIDSQTGKTLGQLSRNSAIKAQMERNAINQLDGFFVSDILAWEYQDSVKFAAKHGIKVGWIPKAKEQGFVYIVQIAGYGKKLNYKKLN